LVKVAVVAVVVVIGEVAEVVRVVKVDEEVTRAVEDTKTHLVTTSSAETSSRASAPAPSAGLSTRLP
jgi:hypothetical protein